LATADYPSQNHPDVFKMSLMRISKADYFILAAVISWFAFTL